jgi:RNA polymerase sigma-70 factor (ECF subfamily)
MGEIKQALVVRLFAEQSDALRDFFRWRVPRRADVEEYVQDVYLRILKMSDTDTIRDPEAYLFTVARNLLAERSMLTRRERGNLDVNDPNVQEQLSEVPSFGGQIDAERRIKRLREVLRELAPKPHAAVVLHYWHGLSYEEVAEKLGVSTHSVKKYLKQALALCRRRMTSLG